MTPTTWMPWGLGVAWAALITAPIIRRASRVRLSARVEGLVPAAAAGLRPGSRLASVAPRWLGHSDAVVVRVLRSARRRRRERAADAAVARDLPVAIDLLGVAVGAGCTPYLAVEVAARWTPTALTDAFLEVLRSCGLGLDLESALDAMARATPRLRPLTDALLTTERLGVPAGPSLARLADEERTALRRAGEAHARRVPVRLLFPLVFLVLPAFVLLTVVPGLAAGLGRL
jgi:hypothetical protein